MGGTRALTIVLATGLGLVAALGAPAETAPPPAPPQQQPQPQAQAQPAAPKAPVPPVEYLKAGARLYNQGHVAQAAKYFAAAERFRAQLSENEQIVLEVYQEEVEAYNRRAAAPRTDPAVAPASMTARTPAAAIVSPAATAAPAAPAPGDPGPSARIRALSNSRFETTDPKQRARWLLYESREEVKRGNLEEAARKLAEAQAMPVKWGRLEDSPDKMAKFLEKARAKQPPQAAQGPAAAPALPTARPLGVRVSEAPPAPR